MFGVNSKTFVCFLIVLILTLLAGFGGLVLGSNARNIFPVSWLSYLPKIGAESVLPLEFDKKPVKSVYLTVSGKIKSILDGEIIIEDGGESIALKLASDLKPFKLTASKQENLPLEPGQTAGSPPLPEAMELKDVKAGDKVSAAVQATKGGLTVVSLMVKVE